jgi:hypothetical protein
MFRLNGTYISSCCSTRPIYETNEPGALEGNVVGISFVLIRWTQFVESLLINDYAVPEQKRIQMALPSELTEMVASKLCPMMRRMIRDTTI